MELKTFIQTLRLKINGLDNFIVHTTKDLAAQEVVKEVKNRVITQGIDANGSRFSDYSKRHSQKRRARGLDTSKKNFQFSGSMWDSFGVVEEQIKSNGVTVWLGMDGQNTDTRRSNQELVNLHSDREGRSIIAVSESEVEKITEELREKVKNYILNVT